MSTPTLGFGWNDVAFSGSSRSSAAILSTRSTSGAGISTATLSLRSRLRVASTEWWYSIRWGPRGSAGTRSSWSCSTAARSSGRCSLSGGPAAAVRGGEGGRAEGVHGGGAVDQLEAGADHLGGRGEVVQADAGQDPVDRAEEERGVLLVDQHRQAAVGRAAGGAPLHAQVGRVAVVAVGDQGLALGQPVVDGGEQLGVPDRPDPVPLLVAVHEVVDRRLARSRGARSRGSPAGARWTRRIGAGLRASSVIRSASSSAWTGWIPSCGRTARSSGPLARCEMSSAPTRPRTVRPPAVYSCR